MKKLPHGSVQYVDAKLEFQIKGLDRPIGIIVLPGSKKIVISEQGSSSVRMYDKNGKLEKTLVPEISFKKPSDMAALPDGRFAVRDDNGIQLFDPSGEFLTQLCQPCLGRVYGLTTGNYSRTSF